MQAALRAKQKNDIEGAKLFLRQAKGLDPMIEASQNGLPVDITKVRVFLGLWLWAGSSCHKSDPFPPLQVPEAPVNKEDFVLVQHRGVHISPEAASQYLELMKLIRQQHEVVEPRGRPKNRVILAACGERLRTRQAGCMWGCVKRE